MDGCACVFEEWKYGGQKVSKYHELAQINQNKQTNLDTLRCYCLLFHVAFSSQLIRIYKIKRPIWTEQKDSADNLWFLFHVCHCRETTTRVVLSCRLNESCTIGKKTCDSTLYYLSLDKWWEYGLLLYIQNIYLETTFISENFCMKYIVVAAFAQEKRGQLLWRLIYAKNPDLQTMYTSIVNVYFFNTAM